MISIVVVEKEDLEGSYNSDDSEYGPDAEWRVFNHFDQTRHRDELEAGLRSADASAMVSSLDGSVVPQSNLETA